MVYGFVRLIYFLGLTSFLLSCGKSTSPDVCFPTEGRFIKGKHYVDANFISEEGTWNYEALVAYYQKHIQTGKAGQCLPLAEKPTIHEQIEKLEKKIDLIK